MPERQIHSPLEVLRVFLKLGLTSFGGPIAHIGYFREEFVARRRWLDEAAFSDLVALCQFLPGPASSQVGFSIGLIRAGYLGGLAAWTGFTLPSAIALVSFAYGAHLLDGPAGSGLLHGLKLVAVAIVAQAVWGMARTLCPDRRRASIAADRSRSSSCSIPSAVSQIAAILFGARRGSLALPHALARIERRPVFPFRAMPELRRSWIFSSCWSVCPCFARLGLSQGVALFDAFYRSGALVFGGGHVVLPLLRDAFVAPGWVSDDTFLAGYGAAQAIPGPLFTFAAYLGAVAEPAPHGIAGAALGLIGIFLPGILILIGTLPFWHALRSRDRAQAAMRGINAAVVGILGGAFYNPVWITSVKTPVDFAWRSSVLFSSSCGERRRCWWLSCGALAGVAMKAAA